jgi:hypothetical protein
MEPLEYHPFDKLNLNAGEVPLWSASNPTFHRTSNYGMLLTEQALYLYSPFWLWLACWRRLPMERIVSASFRDSRWVPSLRITLERGSSVFRTPFDYKDEMDFDRKNLLEAAGKIKVLLASHRKSESVSSEQAG